MFQSLTPDPVTPPVDGERGAAVGESTRGSLIMGGWRW